MFDVNYINAEIKKNQNEYDKLKTSEQQAVKDVTRVDRDLKDCLRDVARAEAELQKITSKRDKLQQEKDRLDQIVKTSETKKAEYEKNIRNLQADLERNLAQIQAGARKKK